MDRSFELGFFFVLLLHAGLIFVGTLAFTTVGDLTQVSQSRRRRIGTCTMANGQSMHIRGRCTARWHASRQSSQSKSQVKTARMHTRRIHIHSKNWTLRSETLPQLLSSYLFSYDDSMHGELAICMRARTACKAPTCRARRCHAMRE
jgi:hypothetical protein